MKAQQQDTRAVRILWLVGFSLAIVGMVRTEGCGGGGYPSPNLTAFTKVNLDEEAKKRQKNDSWLAKLADGVIESVKQKIRSGVGIDIDPASGLPVNTKNKENLPPHVWSGEQMYDIHFGKKNEKGEYDQRETCREGMCEGINYMYWWMLDHHQCELEFRECLRTQLDQFWKWIDPRGGASKPFSGKKGGHGLGTSCDINSRCRNNHKIPLGKLADGTMVYIGKEPKNMGGIKWDKEAVPNVKKWAEAFLFAQRIAEIKQEAKNKTSDSDKWSYTYNEEKCMKHAYDMTKQLVNRRFLGANHLAMIPAREHNIVGGGCTNATEFNDGGHFTKLYPPTKPEQYERYNELMSCTEYSPVWWDYVKRSYAKKDVKVWKAMDDEKKPEILLFNHCVDKEKQ